MKNNFLFNKIIVKYGEFNFIPEQSFSFTDKYLTNCGNVKWEKNFYGNEQGEYAFKPTSLKQFLNCLKRTKLNDNYEYNIVIHDFKSKPKDITSDFPTFIQYFAETVYKDKHIDKEKIIKFYKSAYMIKINTKKEMEFMKKSPKEINSIGNEKQN